MHIIKNTSIHKHPLKLVTVSAGPALRDRRRLAQPRQRGVEAVPDEAGHARRARDGLHHTSQITHMASLEAKLMRAVANIWCQKVYY